MVIPWLRLLVPGRASIHKPDGLVRHVLPVTDDDGVYFRRFYTFRAAVGEFELAAVLHVLHLKDNSKWGQLSIGQVLF